MRVHGFGITYELNYTCEQIHISTSMHNGQGRGEGCVVREGGISGLNRAGYGRSKCVFWEVKWSQVDYCHEHSSLEKYD